MKNWKFSSLIVVTLILLLTSCKVENLEKLINQPKVDFQSYNYVLATEYASNDDITTFFSFNPIDIDTNKKYDLLAEDALFVDANPSTSSGHISMNQYMFSLTKDKKGYSSTPGLYRLTLNTKNRVYIEKEMHVSRASLFPPRQLCIVDEHLGYYYNEGKATHSIQIFDPTLMLLKGAINLKPAIEEFRPNAKWKDEAGNNLIRTGSLVLAHKEGKLYVSVVFLEKAGFNLISDNETQFYLAVIDISLQKVEQIISYDKAITVGFFVSENKATCLDKNQNLYFCSWGWNQFNAHRPSRMFRIKKGDTDFDEQWMIDIESLFGHQRIVQSFTLFDGKIFMHVSNVPYTFADDGPTSVSMSYYWIDPAFPNQPHLLDIPVSNASPRMNVFNVIDDQLYVCVPNIETGKFNGIYSVDKQGNTERFLSVANKYRPTRLYKLQLP